MGVVKMSDDKKKQDITTQDSHIPAPPADGIKTMDSHIPAPPADDTITTMDSHIPAPPAADA
ncbi:hypothetical protein ACWCOW_13130 [Streptomyces sp. NPDC001939]